MDSVIVCTKLLIYIERMKMSLCVYASQVSSSSLSIAVTLVESGTEIVVVEFCNAIVAVGDEVESGM